MNILDLMVIMVYFLVVIGGGYLASKRAKTCEDYNVAGRRLGFFMYFGCITSVILGGASTIGTAQLGYEYGISGIWLVTMLGIGIIAVGILLANKILSLKVITISELLEHRYNSYARLISAIVSSVYTLMVSVTQIIAMGTVSSAFMGWDLTESMLLVGGIVLLYTILGGMWAISMTDIIQFIVMSIGIFGVMLPFSLNAAGGFQQLRSSLPDSYFNLTSIGIDTIIQYLFLFSLGIIVGQDVWQRVFTGKSIQVVRYGNLASGLYNIFYAIAITIIGICAVVIVPNLEDSQLAFASLAKEIIPSGLLGLVISSVLAALMSTASGTVLASSTLITNDIIKRYIRKDISEKGLLNLSRIITFILGVFAMIIALYLKQILVALDIAYAILSGSLFFPIILGIFWKRANSKAAVASILLSSIVIIIGLIVRGISSTDPILYGIATSGITMLVVSLIYPENKKSMTF